jgi:5S rRNA maturation endonuclease (ribonuclease M5)
MKTMKKSSHSIDQTKLKILCDIACDDIDSLLEYFDIEFKNNGKMITMSCPIHGGDNASAVNLYPEGETYRGNWKCRTHNCDKYFKSSIIGFVRGVLSHQKYNWEKSGDRFVSFQEALDFLTNFTNKDLNDIHVSNSDRNKQSFTSVINYVNKKQDEIESKVTREHALNSLDIPSQYFIDRGYSTDILNKYDVGLCNNPNKPMYSRAVVPIYDSEHKYLIGSSGRSIFPCCKDCNTYHNPNTTCPSEENRWRYSKWKHSADFKSQNALYNFWFAKKHILDSGTVIIVESPGNVWRLEESGIHNSVGIFGSSLSDRQKVLLDSSGAMNLVILTDNDEAGKKASEQIKDKCKNTYRIYQPTIEANDIGEMSIKEINNQIRPLLENIQL